jgi:hypothetical protein
MKTRRHRVPFFMMNKFKNRISMRISPLHMLLCLAWLIPLPSQAQTDSCEKASNKDQQVICMAISKKEIKLCEGMSTPNGMYFCQAASTGNSYPCEKITGNRSNCLATVREFQRRGSAGS